MSLLFLSFLAGILTVLAPCAFLLLPVIIGGSVGSNNRWRPYIITASLAISLLLFTLALKATSLLIDINPVFLTYFSGIVIVLLGLISLFPTIWDKIQVKLNLSSNSDKLLEAAGKKEGVLGAILTGAALGPVFSSCSPTYVFVLTTVLREDFTSGILNILAYTAGLSLIMLGVGLIGRSFVKKLKWASNPNGVFKRVIAVLFILAGIGILTGFDKQLQTYLVPYSPVNKVEQRLLMESQGGTQNNTDPSQLFNVNPPKVAPEITGITEWINSDAQTLAKLKGKVVLIDFWTYSCVNCLRNAPYLNSWYDTYKDQGFVIIGLHAPEFAFEKNRINVEKSIRDTYKTKYPVGLDNDFATWDAYENQFWPAAYLIDKDGNLRYTHFGEGEYDKTEEAIRALLKETGASLDQTKMVSGEVRPVGGFVVGQTPETYLGWSRSSNFANNADLKANEKVEYKFVPDLKSSTWSLDGAWTITNEEIISESDTSKLRLKYNAKEVYLVMGASQPTPIKMTSTDNDITLKLGVDATKITDKEASLTINDFRLYKLTKSQTFEKDQTIELTIPKGVRLNAFTFGG
jgi:cytochrome c biogenesis protein CcdA/thiol-disulfide isomerase/thioredoxin